MNILYASDDNFAEIAGVSILSLLENNKDINDLKIYMLDNGISVENKKRLSHTAELYSRKIIFVDMPDIENLTGISLDVSGWSLATFARLFIASVFPKYIEKIIYIDCDTMIRGSLSSLWMENLNGYILGGVLDYISKLQKKCTFLRNTDIYINAGVLIIDLTLWHSLDVERKYINFIKLLNGKIYCVDQGVINGVLSNYIKPLHPKYNYTIRYIESNRKRMCKYTGIADFYTNRIFNEAKNAPLIVHFLGCDNRPWIKGNNNHVYRNEYIRYRNMTPWADFPLRESKEKEGGTFKKTVRKALKRLPKSIYSKYKFFGLFIYTIKMLAYAKKRLKESGIKLEDCYIKPDTAPHE